MSKKQGKSKKQSDPPPAKDKNEQELEERPTTKDIQEALDHDLSEIASGHRSFPDDGRDHWNRGIPTPRTARRAVQCIREEADAGINTGWSGEPDDAHGNLFDDSEDY